MKKSDFLDELRLEVGLAYDYAINRDDFIVRVLKTIHTMVKKKANLTIHTLNEGQWKLTYALGQSGHTKGEEALGWGFLVPNKYRAVTYVSKGSNQVLFLPIHDKEKFVCVISIRLIGSDYHFSKQDMIFAEELIHFIEAKRGSF